MRLSDQHYELAKRVQYNSLTQDTYQELPAIHKFGLAYATFLLGITNPTTRKQYKAIIDHYMRFLVNVYEHQGKVLSPEHIPQAVLASQGAHVAMWRHDLEHTGGVAGTGPGVDWSTLNRYRPNSETSIESKTSILSSFFTFLAKPCMDGTDPLLKSNPIDSLKKRHKIQRYSNSKKIGIHVFKSMLRACKTQTLRGLRDYVLLFGYFMTGRRNSEWVRLRWGDINWNTNPPTYSFTFKGQKSAKDELSKPLLQVLDVYMTKRWGPDYKETLGPDTYLFSSVKKRAANKPLSERQMLNIVKKLAEQAGVDPKRVEVHSLRHLHSEEYLAAGASVEEIRSRLHHESLNTTQRYLSSLSNEGNPLANELDKLLELDDE